MIQPLESAPPQKLRDLIWSQRRRINAAAPASFCKQMPIILILGGRWRPSAMWRLSRWSEWEIFGSAARCLWTNGWLFLCLTVLSYHGSCQLVSVELFWASIKGWTAFCIQRTFDLVCYVWLEHLPSTECLSLWAKVSLAYVQYMYAGMYGWMDGWLDSAFRHCTQNSFVGCLERRL